MSFDQLKAAFDSQPNLKFNAKAWRKRLKYIESLRKITKYNGFVFRVNDLSNECIVTELFALHLLRGLFTGKTDTISKQFKSRRVVRVPHIFRQQTYSQVICRMFHTNTLGGRYVMWCDTQLILCSLIEYALYMGLAEPADVMDKK